MGGPWCALESLCNEYINLIAVYNYKFRSESKQLVGLNTAKPQLTDFGLSAQPYASVFHRFCSCNNRFIFYLSQPSVDRLMDR